MKHVWSVLFFAVSFLAYSSDSKQKSLKEQKTWLGNLCAQKYTLNKSSGSSGYESFSSKSHFIVCELHRSDKNIFWSSLSYENIFSMQKNFAFCELA